MKKIKHYKASKLNKAERESFDAMIAIKEEKMQEQLALQYKQIEESINGVPELNRESLSNCFTHIKADYKANIEKPGAFLKCIKGILGDRLTP